MGGWVERGEEGGLDELLYVRGWMLESGLNVSRWVGGWVRYLCGCQLVLLGSWGGHRPPLHKDRREVGGWVGGWLGGWVG